MNKKIKYATYVWNGPETFDDANKRGIQLLKDIDATHRLYMAALMAHTKWVAEQRNTAYNSTTISFTQKKIKRPKK